MIWGYQTILVPKITQEKSTKFIMIVELYQVFINIFLYQTFAIFPIYGERDRERKIEGERYIYI